MVQVPVDPSPPDPTVVAALRAAGCVFAEDEAALLVDDRPTEPVLAERVRRRVAGEPIEYVLGWAEFCGHRVLVAPGVFVPRRRSEYLVEVATALLPEDAAPTVVDLCCGTGALGVALGHRRPSAQIHGADVDPVAVACAATNLAAVGGTAHLSDVFEGLPPVLRGALDLIVANAPYVPSEEIAFMPAEARLYEHRVALDGGADGLDLHRRIAAQAAELAPTRRAPGDRDQRAAGRPDRCGHAPGGLHPTTVHDEDRDATVVVGTR